MTFEGKKIPLNSVPLSPPMYRLDTKLTIDSCLLSNYFVYYFSQTLPGTPRVGSDAPGTHIDEQTQTPRGKKSTKDGVQHSPPQKLNRSRSPAKSPTPGKESGGRPSPTHSPSPHDGSYTDRFDQSSKTENNQPSLREDGQRATQHVKGRMSDIINIRNTEADVRGPKYGPRP